ncbi:MAG: chalcone and stilbene synthase domain protein [Cyanobacteria bacterium RYN_339]|nr:chalcone and stilbene synthase domain protein [Cyanobacteria bacterium RYN_339]
MTHIVAIGTAVPESTYRQQEIHHLLYPGQGEASSRAGMIFARSAIATRHSVLADPAFLLGNPGTEARNRVYVEEAHALAARAIRRCLKQAGLGPEAVDLLVVVSCTGVETPGLDLTLAAALGMHQDMRRTCILGMGCYAAFPGLQRAQDFVAAHPGKRALVVCVELCTLHLQADESDENLVATALFGDGAAAALVGAGPGPAIVDTCTLTAYDTAEHMSFKLTDHGFKMHLSSYVPKILEANVEGLLDRLLAPHGLTHADIAQWAIHPGGRKILDHVQARLGLTDAQVAASRRVLKEHGNMSSPTVLFVLDELQPEPGEWGVMMAFGPGLTLEAALLRWA